MEPFIDSFLFSSSSMLNFLEMLDEVAFAMSRTTYGMSLSSSPSAVAGYALALRSSINTTIKAHLPQRLLESLFGLFRRQEKIIN